MTTTQSSTKFQVVHVKLSESDECEAKRLSKIIFPYLQMMSGDLEKNFGISRFLSSSARKMPAGLNPTASAMTIFTNLANRSSLTSWTQQKQEAYLFLGDVFYDLITDFYSPALAEFAITRNYQCATSVIDCHELTKLIKSKCTAHDFASPHDSTCFNLSNLKIAADGRHAAVHEQKTKLLSDWDRYLASMICVMKGIGAMSAAKTIGRARSHLVRARDRARRLVNPVQQSDNHSGGQPIATTSNTTQTSRKKSTRRNNNPIRKIPAGTGVNHRRRR
jgi:hypothetical protein